MQDSHTREQPLSNSDRSKAASKSAQQGKAEDIPAALRDGGKTRSPNLKGTPTAGKFPLSSIGIAILLLLAGGVAWLLVTNWHPAQTTPPPIASTTNPPDSGVQTNDTDNLLNHLSYVEAPDAELVSIGSGYRLRKVAAAKFQTMVAAARSSGVNITTISAFRSVEDQKRLFFGVGAERGQQPRKRAEVSAPPKYSEHHTGYAVDVGDGTLPATNLNQDFDTTPAYRWLKAHAATYSFELSFPKDNIQKVSYEPWHWRFVGDINSLETFYRAHNLKGK
jgi:zinc D-Ala-D-Ala carboxypeptidase